MENKKRMFVIAGIHCVISLMILFAAIIMTVIGASNYPKHIHPAWFIMVQRIINFPIVLLMNYLLKMVLINLKIYLNISLIIFVSLITIPLNSLFWGICINKGILIVNKKSL